MGRIWPTFFQCRDNGLFPIRQGRRHMEGQFLVRCQPLRQPRRGCILQLDGTDGRPTQHFVQHIQRRTTSFRLQGVDGPDHSSVLLFHFCQALALLVAHPPQQGQKPTILFTDRSFIDQHHSLVQLLLNLNELPMLVFVLPTNEGQHIQPVGAIGQADQQHASGIIVLVLVCTVRVHTLAGFASYEDWSVHRLYILFDIPSVAIHQGTSTVYTLFKFAFNDDPFGLWESTSRTVTWLLSHFLPLLSYLAYYSTTSEVMTRQPGGGDTSYSKPAYLHANRHHANLVTIARARSNRIFHRQYVSTEKQSGHPRWYGDPFSLPDPTTWHPADEQATTTFVSRRGKVYRVEMQAWHNMLMRGKRKPKLLPMHRYPFTLVRIVLYDQEGQAGLSPSAVADRHRRAASRVERARCLSRLPPTV